ncbi:MAG: hypothetical protein SF052_16135 [Bacteroidia bacterium]|nr:hypothetical protein [Bacteroidia bacterium]
MAVYEKTYIDPEYVSDPGGLDTAHLTPALPIPYFAPPSDGTYFHTLTRGEKRYELTNHTSTTLSTGLGNVLSTVSDRKLPLTDDEETVSGYTADVWGVNDYAQRHPFRDYAFGMLMPGRNQRRGGYRFGFQSQETDPEYWGGAVSYKYRVEDTRLGRFFSGDPLGAEYPFYSPYAFSGNRVLDAVEWEGLEPAKPGQKDGQYESAPHQGNGNQYGWTWRKGEWEQGDLLSYSRMKDDPEEYEADLQTERPIGIGPGWTVFNQMGGEETARATFTSNFLTGTAAVNTLEDNLLLEHFLSGDGSPLSFGSTSMIARLLDKSSSQHDKSWLVGKSDRNTFVGFAQSFEQAAWDFYQQNGTLNGFDGKEVLAEIKWPYISNPQFLWTVMGGVKQISPVITHISSGELVVRYTVEDHFGTSAADAKSMLPGLSELYYLQHYHSGPNQYQPFIWTVDVIRQRSEK